MSNKISKILSSGARHCLQHLRGAGNLASQEKKHHKGKGEDWALIRNYPTGENRFNPGCYYHSYTSGNRHGKLRGQKGGKT